MAANKSGAAGYQDVHTIIASAFVFLFSVYQFRIFVNYVSFSNDLQMDRVLHAEKKYILGVAIFTEICYIVFCSNTVVYTQNTTSISW